MKSLILMLLMSINCFGLTAAEAKKEAMITYDKRVTKETKACIKAVDLLIAKAVKDGEFEIETDICTEPARNLAIDHYTKLGYETGVGRVTGNLFLNWSK